uniref:Uncharacterized protein n=1 Tax=Prorocentrum micans TaxID=2945 RepID=A0A7S2TAW8_PROMC
MLLAAMRSCACDCHTATQRSNCSSSVLNCCSKKLMNLAPYSLLPPSCLIVLGDPSTSDVSSQSSSGKPFTCSQCEHARPCECGADIIKDKKKKKKKKTIAPI